MSYLVLARKWRPQTFSDLIGQEHVSQTLKNAIDGGRVAHAFLFTGARGVGKTSSARILAKALNCDNGPAPEPCNSCPACAEITSGNSVDVFEIDGASNTGVDDIRELRDNIKYLPSRSRFKIFIIDEVHMLSTSAFNALLKTLEEPPSHVKFIFATTEPHKVPVTILSRCQRFDFKRIPLPMIVARLRYIVESEGITISDAALTTIARKGDGSMRDSLSTLDQVLAFCGESVGDEDVVTLLGVVDRRLLRDTAEAVFSRDSKGALEIVKKVDAVGSNMRHFCQELIDYFRNLLIYQVIGADADLSDLSETEWEELRERAKNVSLGDLQRHLSLLVKADGEMGHSSFPRLVMEMALIRMATLVPVVPVEELLNRLKALEGKLSSGVVAAPQPAWRSAPAPAREPQKERPASASSNQQTIQEKPARPASSPVKPEPSALPPGTGASWEGFVSFLKGKKPMLASQLEHGRPLAVSQEVLQIGFPAGSFELEILNQAESRDELKKWAQAYFRSDTKVTIVPRNGETAGDPPSLAEKKSRENDERQNVLREAAASHPAVMAALDVFGAELGAVEEDVRSSS